MESITEKWLTKDNGNCSDEATSSRSSRLLASGVVEDLSIRRLELNKGLWFLQLLFILI